MLCLIQSLDNFGVIAMESFDEWWQLLIEEDGSSVRGRSLSVELGWLPNWI